MQEHLPMKRLSREAFDASWEFLQTHGRPLEISLFRHAFLSGSEEDVLSALSGFRNDDGGFGHALEPDLRAPESSALCTSIAFRVFRSLGSVTDHPMVSGGIAFLLGHLDKEQLGWRIIPECAENSPRAPWWYQAESKERFQKFSLNPTAEILGYLYDYPQQVFLRVRELIDATVARDPSDWEGYCLRPLQVADNPKSPFMEGLEEAVSANLDYEVENVNSKSGYSSPTHT
jgi:hypothetical protein